MERTIRTAVVGIGNMGTAHASCLMRGDVPGMELAAVADIRESRRAYAKEAFPGIAVLETLDQVLEEVRPEAVIIAVPHPKHVFLAEKVLKAGCHLLLEKPEDISVSRALELNAIAEKTDKVFSMMFNQRTNPLFQKARELVQSGALGALKRSTWIITNWYRTESYYRSGDWRATWKGEGGGVLLNQAPHNLDLWQWIVGLPSEVTAFTAVGKYHDIEVEDEAQIFTRYADGSVGVFLTTTGEYPGTNRLEIQGTQGKLVLEERTLKYWKVDGDEIEYRLHAPETEPKPPVVYEEIRYPKGE
ncbi:MAG: Gfo/Idh/MocA family oxidoreductase, partial [Lachnospiraceae bacterium]|nr:Gfo/Idh/MocA family oxidoreductase [Lachnospiraceae bacterium]